MISKFLFDVHAVQTGILCYLLGTDNFRGRIAIVPLKIFAHKVQHGKRKEWCVLQCAMNDPQGVLACLLRSRTLRLILIHPSHPMEMDHLWHVFQVPVEHCLPARLTCHNSHITLLTFSLKLWNAAGPFPSSFQDMSIDGVHSGVAVQDSPAEDVKLCALNIICSYIFLVSYDQTPHIIISAERPSVH